MKKSKASAIRVSQASRNSAAKEFSFGLRDLDLLQGKEGLVGEQLRCTHKS
jgi:hypothetical protein